MLTNEPAAESIAIDTMLSGPAIAEKVARDVNEEHDESLSAGQRAADFLAKRAGSWGFIITFAAVLLIWITLNSVAWVESWDPYPFILLNLALSCLAAIQAPVIMMSQNRQEERDRLKAEADFAIDTKAESEVEYLHKKLDDLLIERIRELLKLQEEQMEILKLLAKKA